MSGHVLGPGPGYRPRAVDPRDLVDPQEQAETNRVGSAAVRAALTPDPPPPEELPPDPLADALTAHVRATYRGDVAGGWVCAGCGLPVPTEARHARHLAEITRSHRA